MQWTVVTLAPIHVEKIKIINEKMKMNTICEKNHRTHVKEAIIVMSN
jgi:hypothetical protein